LKEEYVEDPKGLLWMSTDKALHTDPAFAPHFQRYADDEQVFFDEFALAMVGRCRLTPSNPH
jgi:L-ascorbate peroxidase